MITLAIKNNKNKYLLAFAQMSGQKEKTLILILKKIDENPSNPYYKTAKDVGVGRHLVTKVIKVFNDT